MGEYQWWSSLQNLHMYNIKNCGLPRWHQWQRTCLLKQETRDVSSVPGSGRSPGGGHSNPLQYSLPGESCGQRSLMGYGSTGSQSQTQLK